MAEGLRERKKDETRSALSWAAIQLTVERGFDNVRVEDIAAEAGVSPRTFNNYFSSKGEAIAARHLDRACGSPTSCGAGRPANRCGRRSRTASFEPSSRSAPRQGDPPPDEQWIAGVQLMLDRAGAAGRVPAGPRGRRGGAGRGGRRAHRHRRRGLYPRLVAGGRRRRQVGGVSCWLRADPPHRSRNCCATPSPRSPPACPRPDPADPSPQRRSPAPPGDPSCPFRKDHHDADVVIAGAGPNGLMLACELSLAGVRPLVLERLPERQDEPRPTASSARSYGCSTGAACTSGSAATRPTAARARIRLRRVAARPASLDDNPFYILQVPQRRIEQVLEERAARTRRRDPPRPRADRIHPGRRWRHRRGRRAGRAVPARARYLVGADGGHSLIRKLAGIDFPGVTNDRTVSRTAHAVVPARVRRSGHRRPAHSRVRRRSRRSCTTGPSAACSCTRRSRRPPADQHRGVGRQPPDGADDVRRSCRPASTACSAWTSRSARRTATGRTCCAG